MWGEAEHLLTFWLPDKMLHRGRGFVKSSTNSGETIRSRCAHLFSVWKVNLSVLETFVSTQGSWINSTLSPRKCLFDTALTGAPRGRTTGTFHVSDDLMSTSSIFTSLPSCSHIHFPAHIRIYNHGGVLCRLCRFGTWVTFSLVLTVVRPCSSQTPFEVLWQLVLKYVLSYTCAGVIRW